MVKWGRNYLGFDGKVTKSRDKIVKCKKVTNVKRNDLHPHMLRHGLAIYLGIYQGVPWNVVAARLGHANPFITVNTYMVITPELQRQMTAHVPMR